MIGRTVLAALIAGLVAGLLAAAIHYVRLDAMIAQAETYETAAAAPNHSAHQHGGSEMNAVQANEHAEHEEGWKPAEGFQRIATTTAAWALAGIGFGLLLAGASLLSGMAITQSNAIIWGICGFLAVSVAPAAGLAPELPGMEAADLAARQIWWVGTAVATAIGIYLIASKRSWPALAIAALVIALPHIIGAPKPPTLESSVPAGLAAAFVGNNLAVNAAFWVMLGIALGSALPRFTKELNES